MKSRFFRNQDTMFLFSIVALWVACILFHGTAFAKKKVEIPTLRWAADSPGCSLDAGGTDRFYRYSLASEGMQISLAVDPQELTQSQRRADHVMGVLLTVHNNTNAVPLVVKSGDATLEFVQHYHWQFPAWKPEDLAYQIQNKTDDLMHQTDKDIEKRPEKVESNEERLREHQKLISQMVEFLSTQGLRETTLDTNTSEVAGWIFFPSRGKWVGGWKKHEEFVFRIQVGAWTVEFPFVLPPKERPVLKARPD